MCFSATASFTASAVCGIIGVAAVRRAKKADMMFALMPLIFGAQQALEGMVWLNGGEGCGSFAADGFVIFAFVLWPLYTPLACWLSVTVSRPRKILLALVWLVGLMALLGVYALHRGFTIDFSTHHIRYLPVKRYPLIFDYIYAAVAIAPLLVYQSLYIRMYGLLALTGFVVSMSMFNPGRYSVWCFFAAGSSIVLYLFIKPRTMSIRDRALRIRP
jgi:hypothetical protein